MKFYSIMLPGTDKTGRHIFEAQHGQFRDFVVGHIGGLTMMPACAGWWKNPEGKVVMDTMVEYRIACTQPQFAMIVSCARGLFYREEAFFTAEIGEATIIGKNDPLVIEEQVTA